MSYTSQKKNILKRTESKPINTEWLSTPPNLGEPEKLQQQLVRLEKRLRSLEQDHQVLLDFLEQEDSTETTYSSAEEAEEESLTQN